MPFNRLQRSLRATFLGLAVNVALMIAKFLAGILGAAGLTDDGMGTVKKSKDVCQKIATANNVLIDEALKNLQQAVAINPTYGDAMDYMNLVYRRKANTECGDDAARKADLAQADSWTQKAMGARKANEAAKEKKLQGGIDMSK